VAEQENVVKMRVTPHFTLEIDAEDGTPPQKWKLCYDYRTIAAIECATGLDLKRLEDWKDISSGKQFPVIVHGGLRRYNPEVTLEQVLDVLNPEAQEKLHATVFELLFPGLQEAWVRMQAEKAKALGATASPNVESAPPKP
jgi:hypothetical protein